MANTASVRDSKRVLSFISKWGTLLTIAALFLFFTFHLWGYFLTKDNMISILRATSITAIIAIGMTFAVSAGGMDLSIGATAGFSMNLVAMMFFWHQLNTFSAIIIAICVSSLVGLINGFLIVKLRIPDMLATLSTQFMIQGISITIAGGGSVTQGVVRLNGMPSLGVMPPFFRELGKAPWIILIMLAVVAIAFLFLTLTKHGRYIYVVGENLDAASLSGIPVAKYRFLAYVLSAVCAAIGGVLLASRLGSAQLGAADGYLMPAVAATFIGLSVAGAGKANALGTLAGALLMQLMENGLIMESVPYYSMNIFKGLVLALALGLAFFGKKTKKL